MVRATRSLHPPPTDLLEVSHSLMECSPVPMAELAGAGHVLRYVNPAFCRLVGKSKKALVGNPFSATAQEGDTCLTALERVYRTGEAATHTEPEHPGSHPVYWSYALWPVLGADRHPIGVMMQVTETTRFHQQAGAMNEALVISSVHQHELTEAAEKLNEQLQAEIAERKAVNEALRESEAKYRMLFEGIDEGFCIFEKVETGPGEPIDFRYLAANPAFAAQSGVDDVVGKSRRAVFPGETEDWFDTFNAVLKTGKPVRFERALVTQGRILALYAFRVEDGTRRRLAVIFSDITERKRSEEERGRLAAIVESSDDAIISKDLNSIITTWNRAAERLFGYTGDEAVGKSITMLIPSDRRDEEPEILARIRRGESVEHYETVRQRKNGSFIAVSLTVSPLKNAASKIIGASQIARDITERKQHEERQKTLLSELTQAEHHLQQSNENLEQRVTDEVQHRQQTEATLRQAQKMEAIGQLTGGIAHDFNNLLTIITGNIEILERHLPEDNLSHRYIAAALRGSSRAALLTDRLLAFSRRQPLAPQVVSANRLVAGLEDLLRRTLGEQISIEAVLAGGLWPASVDFNQFENTLINLAVNARDAMQNGGKLTIETANCNLDAAATNGDVPPGQYVGVFVTDTGTGMSPEVVAQAFEPFYTTKETGQGTGLGLSQVYGFIKQSEGYVKIYSEIGKGTTVKIYLPRHRGTSSEEVQNADTVQVPQGKGETVLVVEDDPDVRNYAVEILHHLGYRALAADDGGSALSLLDAHPEVSLLFTDVILPGGMNGRQLVDSALSRHPHLKVLFTTGYARDAIVHQGRLDPGVEVIFKPFRYSEIAARLRQVLDGSRGGGGPDRLNADLTAYNSVFSK